MKRTLVSFLAVSLSSFAGLSQQIDKAKLDAYFDTLANNNRFMGSVAVAHNGELIYTKSVGFVDIEHGLKANENSKYKIGSISKTFTTVLIFKAIEENKLSLNQTIDKFFPEIGNAGKITIEHLLYHRSGIPCYMNVETFLEWNTQSKTEQELIKIISNAGSDFEPDTKLGYSNSNFALLTFVLEKIYRKPYSEMLEEKIIRPTGLKNTYYGRKINSKDNECNSYQYNDGWKIDSETDMSLLLGVGGVVSNPVDLTLFSDALFNGKMISMNSLKQMQTLKDYWGMGLLPIPFHNKVSYGKTGNIDSFISFFSHSLADNVSIAFTSNGVNYNVGDVIMTTLSAVFNKPFEIPEFKTYYVTDEDLNKYSGIYSSEQIPLKFTIIKDNGKLKGQLTGQIPFLLEATGKDKFENATHGVFLEFNSADKTMVLKQGGVVKFVRED